MMAVAAKTINIVLKKDRRKGYFGRTLLGYAVMAVYQSSLVANDYTQNQAYFFDRLIQ